MPNKKDQTDRKIRAVYGPYPRDKKWKIIVHYWDGKRTEKTRASKEELQTLADNLRSQIATPSSESTSAIVVAEYDGTMGWWSSLLATLAASMVTTSDLLYHEIARKDLAAIAQAAQAAYRLIDHTQLENDFEELQKIANELTGCQSDGTRIKGRDPAIKETIIQ